MLQDNNLLSPEYQVPLNFIPGVTKPYPSLDEKRKISDDIRRTISYSTFILPFTNYIKRVKSIELPDNTRDEQRIAKSPRYNNSRVDEHTDDKKSETLLDKERIHLNAHENGMAETNDNSNSINYQKANIITREINEFSTESKDIFELYADNEPKNHDSRIRRNLKTLSEVTTSMPDLNSEELQQRNSTIGRKVSKSSIQLSRTGRGSNEDVTYLTRVQDELRSKLPKTFLATASIGLMNPICVMGNIRRNTINHTDSSVKKNIIPFKKFNSVACDNLQGYRKGSIFSKLRIPPKSPRRPPLTPPDMMCEHPTRNTSPSLFTRAEAYAKSGTTSKEGKEVNRYSSSSVDSFTDRNDDIARGSLTGNS